MRLAIFGPCRVRRDGRVAEGARLESVYTGNRIVGSNPTPSASLFPEPILRPPPASARACTISRDRQLKASSMSALPPKAGTARPSRDVRFGPQADIEISLSPCQHDS